MNRAEKRRREKEDSKPEYTWETIFDAQPMADGMPPYFLLYLYQFALTTPQTYHDTFSCVDPRPSFPRTRESRGLSLIYGRFTTNWY